MKRIQRQAEYTAFVASQQTHLRRIAYALCGDWAQAEDLTQAALVKLYVAWPRVCRDGRELAYARQVLVRVNIDEHRRPWRRESPGLTGDEPSSTHGLPVEERTALFEAVQALPVMQRKVVVLRHWLGLSVEDTAAELGISVGTVKSHSSRAIDKLQIALASEGM